MAGSRKVSGLTQKEKLFCFVYINNKGNGTQAAIEAGYSERSAHVTASRMLNKANIKAEIERLNGKAEEKAVISKERTLAEIAKIAFGNIQDLYDKDGNLKSISDLTPEQAAMISGIEVEELTEGFGRARESVGNLRKVKLWPKDRGLEMLAKYFKIYTDAPVSKTSIRFGFEEEGGE